MTIVLLTGFEPFGGETVNPSWQAVTALARRGLAEVNLRTALLPCVYGAASAALLAAVDAHDPAVVIGVGQAGGRSAITPERIAINIDDSPVSDNAGHRPAERPVVAGGPLAYPSGLPVRAIAAAVRDQGIPATVSTTAGTYVCNHVFYALMHLVATARPTLRADFVHVPYSHEQVLDKPGPVPSLSLQQITEALAVVVRTSVAVSTELGVPAGAVA